MPVFLQLYFVVWIIAILVDIWLTYLLLIVQLFYVATEQPNI